MRLAWLLLCCVGEVSLAAESADLQERAADTFDQIKQQFSSKDALKKNFLAPLTEDEAQMTTLDSSRTFAAQIGCNSNNEYLTVGASINSDGSINLSTMIDSDLNGSVDQESAFNHMDVVCANGYQTCDSGVDDCESYRWRATPDIFADLVSDSETQLFSCYCINNTCGSDLAERNYQEILRSLGNGIASEMQKHDPYYTISDVNFTGSTLNYYGHDVVSCQDTAIPQLQDYKNEPAALLAAGDDAEETEQYAMIKNVATRTGIEASEEHCSINREFDLTPLTELDIIELAYGEGVLQSCGTNCLELTVGDDTSNVIDLSDRCHLREAHTAIRVNHPDNIISATIVESSFEELMRIESDTGLMATVNEYGGGIDCQGFTNHRSSYGAHIDVTEHFTRSGIINLNTSLAIFNAGNYYYKIRFLLNAQTSAYSKFSFYAQGQNYIQCEFSLATGVVDCETDGSRSLYNLSHTINMAEHCRSGSTVEVRELNDYSPSSATHLQDDTVINTLIQTPSCANNLTGIVRVQDATSTSGYDWYLANSYDFTITNPVCTSNESVMNGCREFESRCSLKQETVDGIVTYSDMAQTGLTPIIEPIFIEQGLCRNEVEREFYSIQRTYLCPTETTAAVDIDISHHVRPEITDTDMTISLNNEGSADSEITIALPTLPQAPTCVATCEVRRLVDDTRTNENGLINEHRADKTRYETSIRACEDDVCPITDSEEMTRACGCADSFGKAMSMMQLMRLAGKDMVCVDE